MIKTRNIDHLHDIVRALFSYESKTGLVTWKKIRRGNAAKVGDPVGWKDKNGHLNVRVGRASYRLHRIIWLMVHGTCPDEIDHKNGDPSDNSLENLRGANRVQNIRNGSRHRDGSSRFKGVSLRSDTGKWQVRLKANGKIITVGCFSSETDAAEAYDKAAKKHFGDFARLNRGTQ